jgi:hypothetical protein
MISKCSYLQNFTQLLKQTLMNSNKDLSDTNDLKFREDIFNTCKSIVSKIEQIKNSMETTDKVVVESINKKLESLKTKHTISTDLLSKYKNPEKYYKDIKNTQRLDKIEKAITLILSEKTVNDENIKSDNSYFEDYKKSLSFAANNLNNDKYLGVYRIVRRSVNYPQIVTGHILLKKNEHNLIEVREKYFEFYYYGVAFFIGSSYIVLQTHKASQNLINEMCTVFISQKETYTDNIDYLVGIYLGIDKSEKITAMNIILEKISNDCDEDYFEKLEEKRFLINDYSNQIRKDFFDYLTKIDDTFLKCMRAISLVEELDLFKKEKDKYQQ